MSEVTFAPFQQILARVTHSKIWFATLFSHYTEDGEIATSTGHLFSPDAVLPYTDETKHLLGTTDSPTPPEQKFQWGDHVEVRDEEIQAWLPAIYTGKNDRGVYAILKGEPLVNHWKYCRHADW
ncbi:MAG: hypothetical protein K6F46_10005 [Desulfovibrio sp.]|nr:hypothetical protein [Desulfovibrio sp.]